MSISVDINGGGKDFEVVEDLFQAGVLADIVDKGLVPNKFKKAEPGQPQPLQHKCYFVWIVAELDSDGRNKRVFESFTVSVDAKAGLRKRLKDFGLTDAKLAEMKAAKQKVDLDSYIGTKRMLVLSKEDKPDGSGVFLKVTATMPLPKGQKGVDIPEDFTRKEAQQG
jgi:hypothetical protein